MPSRVVAVVPLVLVPGLGAAQGGFSPGAWVWSGALAACSAAVGIVSVSWIAVPARAWVWVGASAALLGWTILSSLWSAEADQSVLEARRAIVYTMVALAILVLARRGATGVLVAATHAAVSGLVIYALAHYLFGVRRPDVFERLLLSQPLGYANAVGIMAALGLVLAIGFVAHGDSRGIRVAVAATVPPLALALVLTESDASAFALGAGIGVVALLESSPISIVRSLAVTAPGAALIAWLGHRSGLAAGAAVPHPSAHLLALAALGCSAGTAALAALAPARAAATARRLVIAGVACAALAAGVFMIHIGARQPRVAYWHVAWHEYLAHPFLGSGAGTFARAWAQSGEVAAYGGALDAHSLYLETLAELGPIGLAVLAVFLLLPLRAAVARRSARYVPTAAGAYVAFLVHAGLDWDWEMPTVVVTAVVCAGALLLDDATPQVTLTIRARVALTAACLLLGGLAIAGARSHTIPAATKTMKAPTTGAFSFTHRKDARYGLP